MVRGSNYTFLTLKERDNETALDYFLARYFASTQGRFTSPDAPFADQSADNPQSWNLYSYVRNNPLVMIDPTGRRTGDYYDSNGSWMYTDNIKDNKVYSVTQVTESDGTTKNITKDLGITHTQFKIIANIVRQEAGRAADAEENLWIAHTSNNEATAIHSSLYDVVQSSFSSAGDKVSGIATSDSSDRANAARAGVIDVLAGGHDPTGGARRWYGTDFLAWGLHGPGGRSHAKFRQYTTVDIPGDTYSTYESAQTARGNSITYYGTRYNLPAAVFTDPANWTAAGNFHYVTGARRATEGLTATGTRGQTIFWRIN